jgi:hypothetical protein
MPEGRARRDGGARSARAHRITAFVLALACTSALLTRRTAYAQQPPGTDTSQGTTHPIAPAPPGEPAPAPAPLPAPPATVPKATPNATEPAPSTTSSPKDELPEAGYIPGYRLDHNVGMSPYSPRVAGLPGGMTPSYGVPNPTKDWTFRWTGFFTSSLQTSENQRPQPAPGQSTTTFHVPPVTVDEYGSFVGTSTVPGQWVQLGFVYGNRYVSANLSLTTWNPTDPSTFYQIGSQQFINNFYLQYNVPPLSSRLRLHAMAGYFSNTYGSLGQYGLGMYTNALVGMVRGVGEGLVAEYDLSDKVTVNAEDGIMGNRNGMGQIQVIPTGQNGQGPIIFPAAWIHHFHLGIESRGDLTVRGRLSYLTNWTQDNRIQVALDNPQTRAIDESYVKDGHIETYGAEVTVASPILGYFGAAASYTRADNAYPVRGLVTFGGEGDSLTNRWWGQPTMGTGKLVAAGVNYGASIGRIVSYPVPFNTDGPDLAVNVGLIFAESWSNYAAYDSRARYKGGVDLLYTFLPYMAAGLRADVVVPSSHDSDETFYVVSPRLVFKSNWNSRDTVTLSYGKWFYGAHTHPEASLIVRSDRLDDQLFALNVQIWW